MKMTKKYFDENPGLSVKKIIRKIEAVRYPHNEGEKIREEVHKERLIKHLEEK